MKTHWRAVEVFTDAANLILADCKEAAAEHAAQGLLASGATAKRAIQAFETRSTHALRQVLGEVAVRIDHRGRAWQREMGAVEKALEEHIESAPDLLKDSFRLARLSAPSERDAVSKLIRCSATTLRKEFVAFRDGWTAPRARPWRERQAEWYAISLILVGAIIGQFASWVGGLIVSAR